MRCNEYSNKIVKTKAWEELCTIFVPGFKEMDSSGKNKAIMCFGVHAETEISKCGGVTQFCGRLTSVVCHCGRHTMSPVCSKHDHIVLTQQVVTVLPALRKKYYDYLGPFSCLPTSHRKKNQGLWSDGSVNTASTTICSSCNTNMAITQYSNNYTTYLTYNIQ
ncbi:hypothetical protein E2C01_014146 [Portunus trituberculatus]|uniref:Uncharacterized protein n=1 Tax=Portunus trituberculatus TaxID=210409 RepID=A0A5B7DIE8_PORTR|nr:hypothetical protein [Portunus trituberculatus]